MPGVLWGCRSNEKSCAVAPFSETLMSLGSLIHTTYYHLLENVVEKCHKSTPHGVKVVGSISAQVEVTFASHCEWDGPLTGLLFGRLLSRRDSPKPEALPPRRMAQAGSIRLPPGSPMASNLFQKRAASTANGLGNSQLERPLRHRQTSVHTPHGRLGFWEPLCQAFLVSKQKAMMQPHNNALLGVSSH